MHSQVDEEMESTLRLTHAKIQEKRYTFSLAQAEFNKLCEQSEKYSKTLDEIKEKKYQIETLMKAYESRILEYEKSEKKFEKEIAEMKKSVADLKLKILESQTAKQNEHKLFNDDVMQLMEKLCTERDLFCKNTLTEELENNYEESKAYDQELKDLRTFTEEIKSKCPIFTNAKELIIANCVQQMPYIKEEIEKERFVNLQFKNKETFYENTKSSLLQEIHKMEKQL